jgi:hypothetical protein
LRVHRARKDSGDLFNRFGRGDADAFTAFRVKADALELAIDGFATAVHNHQATRMQFVHASERVKHL